METKPTLIRQRDGTPVHIVGREWAVPHPPRGLTGLVW